MPKQKKKPKAESGALAAKIAQGALTYEAIWKLRKEFPDKTYLELIEICCARAPASG